MSVRFKMFSGRPDSVIGQVNEFMQTVSVREVRTEKVDIDKGIQVLVVTIVYAERNLYSD